MRKKESMNGEKFNKVISVLLFLMLFFSSVLVTSAVTAETPEKIYYGINNASTILNNIDFRDVRTSNTWAKEAICEVSAFDIVKGYGDKVFGRLNYVTKEQAIAMIYRAVGREADAQLAAEALDNARDLETKKKYAPSMWSDGYLQLAANDGLISQQDLQEALIEDTSELTEEGFYRGSPAQRQDVAYWMARMLGLQQVYGQQKIFNSYNDWTSADPIKVPYIEAILGNNIMNGMGDGYFRPTNLVTREQIAQIIKNALPVILPLLGYEREIGTVEEVIPSKDYTQGQNITRNTFNVRNSNGKLHQIITESSNNPLDSYKNEVAGTNVNVADRDLIVFKGGWIGKGSVIKPGDRIEYITTQDGTVRFVKVISSTKDTKYIVAKINNIDGLNSTLNISKVFDVNYPTVDIESRNFSFNSEGNDADITFVYSNNVEVYIDDRKSDIASIVPGTNAILAVRDNIVVAIKTVNLRLKEKGVVNGIVEDCNPQLGYITLYSESGSPGGLAPTEQLKQLRTYNYSNPRNIEVIKNQQKSKIEDIEVGDSVFIKLDDNGSVLTISAVTNYSVKFAKVISKKPLTIAVRYDDGTQQVLDVEENISVIEDKKLTTYGALKDGDRVKLLLNITDKFTKLKEITIEGSEHYITNIYKGIVTSVDSISNKLVLQNVEVLQSGKWIRTDTKGFSTINLSEENKMYLNNESVNADRVNKYLRNNEAYVAVERDYGGGERAVIVSFKNKGDTEAPVYDDIIASTLAGSTGEFSLSNEYQNMSYGQGTIIIKDKRLVSGNSISKEDMAYIVANRSFASGDYYARVVQISERSDPNFVQIYRARIASIDENKSFMVNSFSQLSGLNWEFYNTPKTFRLTYDTRIVDDIGVVGQRDFVDYGDASYKDRTVYILTSGTDAVLVNTAPYGNINGKGEIYEISGSSPSEEGAQEQEPTQFKLLNAKVYDVASHMWVDSKDMTLGILKNSIILKDNAIAKPSDLKKGDKVRVIKKDNSELGEAYIIIVE